jgi:hypothetical protein
MIKWGDKIILGAEDAVYDWKGNRETIFNNDINKKYLINLDWVKDFEVLPLSSISPPIYLFGMHTWNVHGGKK